MKHRIDPKIDCVFKALLGSVENRNLLVHFLNAILENELKAPIATVDLLNPYNEKEFLDDKISIVDVKAQDSEGKIYQVEIQLLQYADLPARMAYTWADIYSQQLHSGNQYSELVPTYAIWILDKALIQGDSDYVHAYKLRDEQGRLLVDHGGIWLLELPKFNAKRIENEAQRWLRFFKDGEDLDGTTVPDWMTTTEMRQAMETLRRFSEKDRDYHEYQGRQNFIRQQQSIQSELDAEREGRLRALQREQTAMQREQTAVQREQAALAEVERLKALLADKEGKH